MSLVDVQDPVSVFSLILESQKPPFAEPEIYNDLTSDVTKNWQLKTASHLLTIPYSEKQHPPSLKLKKK